MSKNRFFIIFIIMSGFLFFINNLFASDSSDSSINTLDTKIIGGYEADENDWPWMAILAYNSKFESLENLLFCGGSLIGSKWVVTAAHCVEDLPANDLQIVLGVHNLHTDSGDYIGVANIFVHPDYSTNTLDSDIALVELEREVSYSTVEFITDDFNLNNQTLTAIGWGVTNTYDGRISNTLQQVELPFISTDVCNEGYNNYAYSDYEHDPITENMICAGYKDGGKDSCSGDSGGPLLVKDDGTWKIAGITSFGEGCAQPNLYGVYTKISSFIPFILSTTGEAFFPIQGHVTTSFAGHESLGVNNATVSIEGTNIYTNTDEDGFFYFDISNGNYNINISASDLISVRRSVTLKQYEKLNFDIYMSPNTVSGGAGATLYENLDLHVPIIFFNSHVLWADFHYINEDGRQLFEIVDSGVVE